MRIDIGGGTYEEPDREGTDITKKLMVDLD
jgi:hypothetical protein